MDRPCLCTGESIQRLIKRIFNTSSPPQCFTNVARRSDRATAANGRARISMDEARRILQDDDDECVKIAAEYNETNRLNTTDRLLTYR